ncbi:MAG: hypothetical protein L0Y71_01695 [Gemmataceae bacterium]|nr:hypothetical protein [Gemmataceae bacterium]
MRPALLTAVVLLVASQPCWAQFVRPPIIIPRPPPVPVHIPVHIPTGARPAAQGGGNHDALWWALGGGAGALAVGGGAYAVYRLRRRAAPRAIVRIVAMPPGEAPETVRQAWIGLELPLIEDQTQTEYVVAQQVLSHQPVTAPAGYAVEGKTAVEILESAAPEAAAWWRQNAPEALTPGYQLIFPAEVCDRMDDLGR